MSHDSLHVTDIRTQKAYEIPLREGAIWARDLRQIKTDAGDAGLLSYDPGFSNTASCRSEITQIEGLRGTMCYRGYAIQDLVQHGATYLEVAYLLIYGRLPNSDELSAWEADIHRESLVHENIQRFVRGFLYDAHPMSVLSATVAALSTFYHDARDVSDEAVDRHVRRLLGKAPTLAAMAYRRAAGRPAVYPDARLSHVGNMLSMLFKGSELEYEPDPLAERALNTLFVLHADHAQNCSTATMRIVGSSLTDPYTAMSAAMAALFGQRHGGAGEAVLQMLQEIATPAQIPAYLERVKAGEMRLAGFGHRIYKTYDPRALVLKNLAQEIVEAKQDSSLWEVALALEEAALAEPYFHERELYPNVDYYAGLVYHLLGIPANMFTAMFAVARTAGWLAQWREALHDPDQQHIARPRQIYTGSPPRPYVPASRRPAPQVVDVPAKGTAEGSLEVRWQGNLYRLPIRNGAVPAPAWRQIRMPSGDGLVVYDPSFANTATCRSRITFVDGDQGILRYRGYAIEELVENSTYLETAYLLIHGELPTSAEYEQWTQEILARSMVHEKVRSFLDAFRYDAHPMGILVGVLSGLSAFYPEARQVHDPEVKREQAKRLLAQMPTLAAFAYRHVRGFPYIYPRPELGYVGNLLSMMFARSQHDAPAPLQLSRALERLLILEADHEQSTSATAMRTVGSAFANPYSALAAAAAALHGPRHGGAAEMALQTFREIGDPKHVRAYVEEVKQGKRLLMGFGHRIYKTYDPRAVAAKAIAHEVFAVTRSNPALEVALELERVALEDPYFVERHLYPNIYFYSGFIYEAIGIPPNMFSVLVAVARTAGWLAQWLEMLEDREQRIVHPTQISAARCGNTYAPLAQR